MPDGLSSIILVSHAAGETKSPSRHLQIIDDENTFTCVFRPKVRRWVHASGLTAGVAIFGIVPTVAGIAHQVDALGWSVLRATLLASGVLLLLAAGFVAL